MPTRRSSPKRSGRLGREREGDPAQEELPLDAIQQKIHAVLAASLSAPLTQTEAIAPVEAPGLPCEPLPVSPEEPAPLMPVRRLQNYAYCPRLFYYQWVENLFEENADTVAGSAVHRQIDKPSALPEDPKELELPEGARLRSLQLESETLGLVGKIDVCEGTGDGIEVIDHKKGSARRGEGGERLAKEYDAVQVAAYALLLREQGQTVNAASIYYAADPAHASSHSHRRLHREQSEREAATWLMEADPRPCRLHREQSQREAGSASRPSRVRCASPSPRTKRT